MLLPYVFSHAQPGDPKGVCAAIESFAAEILKPLRQWFKIAGGRKADILREAVREAPDRGSILEIGTYFGYSSISLAAAFPQRRIITVEVDPLHAAVASSLVAYAGLAHRIDVWTGYSGDVLARLPRLYDGI